MCRRVLSRQQTQYYIESLVCHVEVIEWVCCQTNETSNNVLKAVNAICYDIAVMTLKYDTYLPVNYLK
jgi:hypothetical protein